MVLYVLFTIYIARASQSTSAFGTLVYIPPPYAEEIIITLRSHVKDCETDPENCAPSIRPRKSTSLGIFLVILYHIWS
ncbi:hypothetical protein JB92DRAFT_1441292 [Gautieria morchelliformis]|nr:hypothetical protein JB92DRAFT_1441292 [Gautieria morchelliformis]